MASRTRKPLHNLAETIHSLLGQKSHLTSSWVKSVCHIIINLPSEEQSIELRTANLETMSSSENLDDDLGNPTSKITGKSLVFISACISFCFLRTPTNKMHVIYLHFPSSTLHRRWTCYLDCPDKWIEQTAKAGSKWISGFERLVIFNEHLLKCRLEAWCCTKYNYSPVKEPILLTRSSQKVIPNNNNIC